MNHIVLDRICILNFKGIEKLQISFDPRSQNIWGENGTGKTTIADAFQWLLFGKNSLGEADFGIKRLDKDGKKVDKTDVEVEGTIDFNGRKITLKHRFIELWTQQKGSEERKLTGNTHEYFVDNAPYKLAEYKAFINKLVDEAIFPMITNPLHFNRLAWQKRREILLSISGDISNADLAAAYPEFKELVAQLSNKTLSKYKQEVVANKKLSKDQLEGLPTRIDEVRRGMPVEQDYEAIVAQVQNREERLAEIDAELLNVSKASETFTQTVRDHQARVRGLKLDQDGIASVLRYARKTEEAEAGRELAQKRTALDQTEKYLTDARNALDRLETRKGAIRKEIDAG
ncbi:MAG TPA: AAA family ATPase, partial [Puia sp.]|nr:AAA family ATPase [Puia sp.]